MKRVFISESGQHLVQFALILPVLLAFMGLVIDVGNAYVHQRLVQNAADAAASAGGMVLYSQGTTVAENTARYYANIHGYSGGAVQITWPSQCIRVQVTEDVAPIFAAMVWRGTFRVGATAQACYRTTGIGASVLILDPHKCEALDVGGSATLRVLSGNIHVNSDCARAVKVYGSARVITQTPLTYVGGVSHGGRISPAPARGSQIPDPLAHLPVPAHCSACPSSGSLSVRKKDNLTLTSRCYMGGINMTGGTITFAPSAAPRVVCIGGDGLNVNSGVVNGSNVTLYFVQGSLDLTGGDINLTPPSSGDYAGVVIFQARNNSTEADLRGNVSLDGSTGIFYMPGAELEINGGSGMRINFVVRTLEATGNATMEIEGYAGPGWTSVTDVLDE